MGHLHLPSSKPGWRDTRLSRDFFTYPSLTLYLLSIQRKFLIPSSASIKTLSVLIHHLKEVSSLVRIPYLSLLSDIESFRYLRVEEEMEEEVKKKKNIAC